MVFGRADASLTECFGPSSITYAMTPNTNMLEVMHFGTVGPELDIVTRDSSLPIQVKDSGSSSGTFEVTSSRPSSAQHDIGGLESVDEEIISFRRFKPEVLETSLRHGGIQSFINAHERSTQRKISSSKAERESSCQTQRKFMPLLVDSVRRSRRSGDITPALQFRDKTDVEIRIETLRKKRRPARAVPSPPTSTPLENQVISTSEARRLGIPLPRREYSSDSDFFFSTKKSPNIPAFDRSKPDSSVNNSPSPTIEDRADIPYKSSGTLLEFAATNADRQLREQALAAFPNNQVHLRVHHYLNHTETPTNSSPGSLSSSMHELETENFYIENWDLKELRTHHEKLDAEREQQRLKREARRKLQKKLDEHPWAIPLSLPENDCVYNHVDKSMFQEISRERPRVRPPMLGADIEFPRSNSPDGARFDVTQGPESLKKAMCYLSEQSELSEASGGTGGLWLPKKEPSAGSCVWGRPSCMWSRPASRAPSNAGLWGGSCLDANSPPRGPTGIMTPKLEEEPKPIPKDTTSLFQRHLPPSPPPSSSGMTSLDVCLETETNIEAEFDDSFITQVYNYMSLGYPAVARDFDEELSKVTGTPIADLRKDDNLPRSCGYIRLGEETAVQSGVTEANCARWKALRVYILEWARQQPNMAQVKPLDAGWPGARKSSWAH